MVLTIVDINHVHIQKLVLVKINQILVMITVLIIYIKEALCFYKIEPFLTDGDSITENEDTNINDINGSYVSNI